VMEHSGVGASTLKNVQRTTRRVRRAGAKTGVSQKMGQMVFRVADFVGVNFLLGLSGLKLETMEKVEMRKVVSCSDASSIDDHYDILNEEYPEECDSEDDPEFVPNPEDDLSSSDEEMSDDAEVDEDVDSSEEEDENVHHNLLKENYPEDCDSEDDLDFIPGDESSSSEEEASDEEVHEDDCLAEDLQEGLKSEARVDSIVPVVVKHEMVSADAVCTDLEKVVEEVIFEEGHCVPMVIKSEPIDEEVQFEEGHAVPMIMKSDPMEVVETSSNSTIKNLLDHMDNLYAVESLSAKKPGIVTEDVENSPAIVLDELGPVSARISALERVVEMEKSPKISKVKIAGESGDSSEMPNGDGYVLSKNEGLEAGDSLTTQENEVVESDVVESDVGEVHENGECGNTEGYYKLDVEKKNAEDMVAIHEANVNCDVNDVNDEDVNDCSETDMQNEVEDIIENIIDCATPECKKVEHVLETSSDSSSDSELD